MERNLKDSLDELRDDLKYTIKENPSTVIQNNSFIGVKWDESALETLHVIARALLNMTEVFRSSNVHIEAMLKVNQDNESSNNKLTKD